MEMLHRRCCGLDVHKETVVACLRLVSDGKVTTEVRTFQTTTADLPHKRPQCAECILIGCPRAVAKARMCRSSRSQENWQHWSRRQARWHTEKAHVILSGRGKAPRRYWTTACPK